VVGQLRFWLVVAAWLVEEAQSLYGSWLSRQPSWRRPGGAGGRHLWRPMVEHLRVEHKYMYGCGGNRGLGGNLARPGGMAMWNRIGRGCYFYCGRRQEDRRADVIFEKICSFWDNLRHVYRVYKSPSSLDIIKGQIWMQSEGAGDAGMERVVYYGINPGVTDLFEDVCQGAVRGGHG
jgi:hypothetical protein